ncbi:MAG: CDP-alcohol phosphatidyltransferase [Candidatus Dadabacteria bacterium]|nr:MAG: CDP-alcohol phosphatidyltransferase [Candidatus Dadabacteria bacterium]
MPEEILNWMLGRLSSTGRIISALWPMLLLAGYFVIGLLVYVIRWKVVGPYRDEEIESRGSTVLAGMWFRQWFAWMIRPILRFVSWTGIPANAITTLSLLLAIGAGVSVAAGRFSLGGWLYIFAGICDFLDGRIARTTGTATPTGSALDSILDRYSDSAILVGLAWYYRDSWVLFATLLALVGSLLVPYVRAKGESLGIPVTIGVMQRVERIAYLGITVALSPILEALLVPNDPHPPHRLAMAGIVMLAFSTQLTALQRFFYLLGELGGKPFRMRASLGRNGIGRNAVASVIATGIDFASVVLMVQHAGLVPWLATALGCLLGGAVNFVINRIWTFGSDAQIGPQIWRYAFVSLTSMALNAGGVAVLLLLPALDYRLSWWLVRIAVFFAWNYPLHRDYVFIPAEPESPVSV